MENNTEISLNIKKEWQSPELTIIEKGAIQGVILEGPDNFASLS